MNIYKIKDIVSFQNGFAFNSKDMGPTGTNIIKIKEVKNNKITITESTQKISNYDYDSMKKYLVSDLLHEGAENGTMLTELVQLTGEDERSIRRRIQAERKAGKLILADCKNGYFLPTSTLDIQRFISSMSRRSREIAAISRAAEDALLKMTGQETLRGWQNG